MKTSAAVSLIKNFSIEACFAAQYLLAAAGIKMRQSPRLTILAFSVAILAYKTSKAVLIPRQLSHLPCVNSVDLFWSHVTGESADLRSQRLLLKLMTEHGLCIKYMMGRWTVTVGDPLLLQHLLRDPKTFPKEVNASLDPVIVVCFFKANILPKLL